MPSHDLLGRVWRRLKPLRWGKTTQLPPAFSCLDDLVDYHFTTFSEPLHINRTGMTVALRRLQQRPSLLLETGTSAWGTDSSRLWASYVSSFGGDFWSVDIRPEASEVLGDLGANSHFHVGDSIEFLNNFRLPSGYDKADLIYLDSFDLDVSSPEPAMAHGLREWQALQHLLGSGSVIIIDDTPIEPSLLGADATCYFAEFGRIPGKGTLVLEAIGDEDVHIAYHHYNVVLIAQ